MKNFFKNLIGKIYPQGVTGKNNNISDVYAGPDDMDDWKKKKKITGKVYAGPGMMKKDEMRCVYAGPEYFNKKKNPTEGVYAGPEMTERERDKIVECVYAGPPEDIYDREPEPSEMEDVYMGPPEDDPVDEESADEKPADEQPVDQVPADKEPAEGEKSNNTEDNIDPAVRGFDPSSLGAVYAGPEQMQDPNKFLMAYAGPSIGTPVQKQEGMINNPNTMMVYAGPVQMQNLNQAQFLMAYAGPNMMNNAQLFRIGTTQDGNAPQPTDDQKEGQDGNDPAGVAGNNNPNAYIKCPCCGTKCSVGQKFCNECGFMLKDVEVTNETTETSNEITNE